MFVFITLVAATPSYYSPSSIHHHQQSIATPLSHSYQQRTDVVSNPVAIVKPIIEKKIVLTTPVHYQSLVTAPALHQTYSYANPWSYGSYGSASTGLYYGGQGVYGSYAARVPTIQTW